jgi:hypothetical protein
MARGRKAPAQPLTTAQQLGSLIKSARDIMRKDKGLSTDIDRLPMLTWIMFLKFLDDIEVIEETNAAMARKRHRPAIEPPYRARVRTPPRVPARSAAAGCRDKNPPAARLPRPLGSRWDWARPRPGF